MRTTSGSASGTKSTTSVPKPANTNTAQPSKPTTAEANKSTGGTVDAPKPAVTAVKAAEEAKA